MRAARDLDLPAAEWQKAVLEDPAGHLRSFARSFFRRCSKMHAAKNAGAYTFFNETIEGPVRTDRRRHLARRRREGMKSAELPGHHARSRRETCRPSRRVLG